LSYELTYIGTANQGILVPASRNTPAYSNGLLVLGDQQSSYLMAVNASTGSLVWKTLLGTHPAAIVTQSPTIYNGKIFVGLSSAEESYPNIYTSGYNMSFYGTFHKVDLYTGNIDWTFRVIDNSTNGTYTGGAIWGSSPAIDTDLGYVYFATGNNYDMPDNAKSCIAVNGVAAGVCIEPTKNRIDSIIAVRISDGSLVFSVNPSMSSDYANAACLIGQTSNPACPPANLKGGDFDFGQAPMLHISNGTLKALSIGQKSGDFWTLDRTNGTFLNRQSTGPGSVGGGVVWGSCTNGNILVTSNANRLSVNFKMVNGNSTKTAIWTAFNATTGSIIWQIPDPTGGKGNAAMTCTPTLVFMTSTNFMFALDITNGNTLWKAPGLAASTAGPAVVNGLVLWGGGYNRFGTKSLTPGKMYAFIMPGVTNTTTAPTPTPTPTPTFTIVPLSTATNLRLSYLLLVLLYWLI
jgi:polyvinyl alcohol dehydrogenase (cytochrome)